MIFGSAGPVKAQVRPHGDGEPHGMKRSRHLAWIALLLALAALLALVLGHPEPEATSGLSRLCRHLDSLTELRVAVSTRWLRAGAVQRADAWELSLAGRRLEARARSGFTLECGHEPGVLGRAPWGTFGPPGVRRSWQGPAPAGGSFREVTGAFLGIPTLQDRDHPGKEDGAIPYALGSLVQADTERFLMIHVLRWEDRGLEGGLRRLSFFQDGLDWDLWMDDSARPLPRRLQLRWAPLADGRPGRVLEVGYDWEVPAP